MAAGRYPAFANGVAVALDGRLVAIDIVDKPATLEKVWNKVTEGFVVQAGQLVERDAAYHRVQPNALVAFTGCGVRDMRERDTPRELQARCLRPVVSGLLRGDWAGFAPLPTPAAGHLPPYPPRRDSGISNVIIVFYFSINCSPLKNFL